MIHYGNNSKDTNVARKWLNNRLGEKVARHAKFIGSSKNGLLTSVCAFSGYNRDDVELSFACDKDAGTPGLLFAIFAYVFEQLQCTRCTAKIREDNDESVNLVTKIGFVQEGRMRRAKSGKDVLVFGLLKEDFYGKFT